MPPELSRAVGGVAIQAFPLTTSAKINLTAADTVVAGVKLIRCVVDGDIAVTFTGETAVTISLVEGDDYAFPYGASVDFTGSAGTFHVA